MTRILLGIIATLCLILGLYFWISEDRIAKLHKEIEANIAKVAIQDQTIKDYSSRLNLVQTSENSYQITLQDIQEQAANLSKQSRSINAPLIATEDSNKATLEVNQHFNQMFNDLNLATSPKVKK